MEPTSPDMPHASRSYGNAPESLHFDHAVLVVIRQIAGRAYYSLRFARSDRVRLCDVSIVRRCPQAVNKNFGAYTRAVEMIHIRLVTGVPASHSERPTSLSDALDGASRDGTSTTNEQHPAGVPVVEGSPGGLFLRLE